MRRLQITRALQITLYAWNKAIQNAIDDYHAAPSRTCRYWQECDDLAEEGDYCPTHRRAMDRKNKRRRDQRKAAR